MILVTIIVTAIVVLISIMFGYYLGAIRNRVVRITEDNHE